MRRPRSNSDRIGMTVSRATIEKVDDKKKMQSVNLRVGRDEQQTEVEHFHPYGFTAVPKKPSKKEKAEGIIVYPGGDRGQGVVIVVGDRRYRLKGMKEGEVALHDDQGQSFHIGRDGVTITTAKWIRMNAAKIVLNGEVHLGGEGGKLVHRKTDADSAGDTAVGSATKVYAL